MTVETALLGARAAVLADLQATASADASAVSLVEDAVAARRWWVSEWPDGAAYLPGLVAQDVQEALFDAGTGRWPLCPRCSPDDAPPHELRISPDLGRDPHWVCERTSHVVAPLGALQTPA